MVKIKDVDALISKNIVLRERVLSDFSACDFKKERKEFLKKIKNVKSQVIRKSMIRSLVMKNILLRFMNEDSSFLEE